MSEQPASLEPTLKLFGVPELRASKVTSFLPERRYQLLVLLALRGGQWVSRDEVGALLWPDRSAAEARRNLRKVVFMARNVPGAEALEATEHRLRWPVATDLQSFEAARFERRLQQAFALASPDPLAGIDDPGNAAMASWLSAERERLRRAWHDAAVDWLDACSDGDARLAVAQRMLDSDSLDETAVAAVMRAHMQRGRRVAAQQCLDAYAARLAAELGVEPSSALRNLLTTVDRDNAPASTSVPVAEDCAFIGRRVEQMELVALLVRTDCRLLTILGPGGVGKSTLARRASTAVATMAAAFAGGVHWIELQDLMESGAVLSRLAQVLGVELKDGADPVDQLQPRLSGDRLLVALDNAEHLADLPALLARLMAVGPALTLLLTSRARMAIESEWLLPLDGLAVPDADSRDLQAARAFDSVRLFELRATQAQRGFSLDRHLDAVVDIVEAVAGMPLAIELAATWVRLLPPAEIAADLCRSLDLLDRDPGAPARLARPEHASMRRVLARSWQLLGPRERDAMQALSVFVGGFTRAAARAVADVPLPLLSALVDKSFLKVDESGRFGMHPLVSADVIARMSDDAPMRIQRRDRHAEHVARSLSTLAEREPEDHKALVAGIEVDAANCHAAWLHVVEHGRFDLVRRMLPAWRRYFTVTGRFRDGVRHLQGLTNVVDADGNRTVIAEALAALAFFLVRTREPARARPLALRSLALAEANDDQRLMRECLSALGGCAMALGDWSEARARFEQGRGAALALGDRSGAAVATRNLGLVATFQGDYDAALGYGEEAIGLQRELGDDLATARSLCNLLFVHMARADWPKAKQAGERALRFAIEHRADAVRLDVEFLLGASLIEVGELDAAANHLAAARERASATSNATFEMKAEYYLARLEGRRGHADAAGRSLLDCARRAAARGWKDDLLYMMVFVAELLRDRGWHRPAVAVLHAVLSAPDEDADAAIRAQAHACLATLAAGDVPAETANRLSVDDVATHLAHADSLATLVSRIEATLA